jgi:hypothetical protein
MPLEETFSDKLKSQLIRGTITIALIEGGRNLLNFYLINKSLDFQIPPQITPILGTSISLMISQIEFRDLGIVKQLSNLSLINSKRTQFTNMESKIFSILEENIDSSKTKIMSERTTGLHKPNLMIDTLIDFDGKKRHTNKLLGFYDTKLQSVPDYQRMKLDLMKQQFEALQNQNTVKILNSQPKTKADTGSLSFFMSLS